jgi:hypothetical protein
MLEKYKTRYSSFTRQHKTMSFKVSEELADKIIKVRATKGQL